MNSIVVHYQEIALKGKNRPVVHRAAGAQSARARSRPRRRDGARADGAHRDRARPGRDAARRWANGSGATFGIANFSLRRAATRSTSTRSTRRDPRDLGDRDVQQLPRVGAPRRQALSADLAPGRARDRRPHQGSARLDGGPRACRSSSIHVELLTDEAFYFFGKERGPGGLPTGTAGRVACLLSGGIDSPVAAHRMMKRGCAVTFVHFHSYPILSRASQEKARELVALLTRWQQRSRLYLVPFGDDPAAGGSRRPRPDARGRLSPPDAADCRAHRADARRAGARDRRRGRPGGVADAGEPRGRRQRRARCRCSGRSSAWTRTKSRRRRRRSGRIRSPSSRTRTAARCSRRATR